MKRNRMSMEGLEALLARTDVWLLIFGVFVAVGVAGESFFGIRHWWNSRLLRKLSDAEAKAKDKEIASLRLQVEESRRTNLEMQRRIQPREIAAELMPA